MSQFLETIGLISGALGIIQFGLDNFPGEDGPTGAVVGVKAGLAADLSNAGGGIDTVYGYDYDNQYLGSGEGGDVEDGQLFSTTIDQSAPDSQADFVGVTFTDDAVCVAWITVTMHDGSPSGAWTGDVGSFCGETWYPQTQAAGEYTEGGEYRPRCTWFDADHTTGSHASLKFRTRAYGVNSSEAIAGNHVCESTLYGVDATPIDGEPAKRKRNTSIRPQWMQEQLVISSIQQHSAKDLCDSATSWGPDFIDSHGQYCDMATKTLHPLCSAEDIVGCVDSDGNSIMKRAAVGKRDAKLASKTFRKVLHW